MKHLFHLVLILVILFSSKAYSQSPLPVGKNQLNIGVGLSSWGVPFYIGLDHSVHPDITIGGEFSYRSYKESWRNENYDHSVMGFSVNGNYHFNTLLNIPQNWDFYAGLNVGFYAWNSPSEYRGNYNSGLGLGAQVGGRYYFNNKIGLNLEFGGGNAFGGGKVGLTLKL